MKSLGQQKCKILVVDDDPCIRRLFRATLDSDYQVEEAASGQEAIMLAADATFDLLLLDITMPGLGGYKTCRRLKSVARSRAANHHGLSVFQLGGADRGLPRRRRRLLSEAGQSVRFEVAGAAPA